MPTYIEDERSLAALCERLAASPSFGLDMEFQRERTYFSRLCLVQIALPDEGDAPGELAIVDPLRVRDLSPLYALVADPAIETILHAGRQDMEIVHEQGGVVPRNIFDTQIGAALIGQGDQPGYATLVERYAGVRLSKLETITDWSRRPLTPGQIEYAVDDVRYLHGMRKAIGRKLAQAGRTEWAREEMCHYEEVSTYVKELSTLFWKLPRIRSLGRRNLAVARALAAWREEEAMRRNEPRNRVVSDDVLVEAARRLPKSVAQLEILRGFHPNEARRSGPAMIAVVAAAAETPEAEWPVVSPARAEDPELSLVVDLLEVFLRARAREAEIAPSYLGSRHDLAALIDDVRGRRGTEDAPLRRGESPDEPPLLLAGWRRQLVGDDLVAIARGEVNLHVDATSGRVTTSARG